MRLAEAASVRPGRRFPGRSPSPLASESPSPICPGTGTVPSPVPDLPESGRPRPRFAAGGRGCSPVPASHRGFCALAAGLSRLGICCVDWLGRMPLRVFSIDQNAFPKKRPGRGRRRITASGRASRRERWVQSPRQTSCIHSKCSMRLSGANVGWALGFGLHH